MSDIAISVQHLSKRYRIGLKEQVPDTFVGALTSWLKSPLANYRQLHKLSDFRDDPLDQAGHELGATPEDVLYALRDVSFDIKKGEVVGIIGRNGAGKSTLLKILSRITEPTSGRVEVHGRVASLLEVGTGFHPELTGRENIYLNGTILGMRKAEIDRKFDEIVAFSEIEKFLDTPVKRYSSGMYVRLAFAVAAHLDPEILIVDEVLAVGDAQFQRKCLGKMREVSSQLGRTVLFVSHNMDAISSLCSHAVAMHAGRVTHFGSVPTALKLYGDQHENARRHWRGPARDDQVTLHETWIETRGPAEILDCGQELAIGLRYEVHHLTDDLIVGYQLLSEYGYELIYSLQDDAASAPAVTPPGHYRKRFVIPANMLTAGSYRVAFDIGIHNTRRIVRNNVANLGFELNNLTGIGRAHIIGQARGSKSLLRPSWPVETEILTPISDSSSSPTATPA